jgi:hypothetical protein
MIQKEVELHDPFGASELGPGKQGQTQGYGGAVQGKQLVFKPKFMPPWGCTLTHREGVVEEISKQLPGPMGIGIGEGGFLGAFLIPRCLSFPRQQARPPHISLRLLACANWQKSMATK